MSIIKVLIIDDDFEMTNLIKHFLHEDQFEVYVVNSSKDGIEAVRQLEPDVIVLDLMMPVMDGWEVCRQIRAFSQIPILVLSVVVKPEQVARSLDEGANDYLNKPVTQKVLVSHLKKLAGKA